MVQLLIRYAFGLVEEWDALHVQKTPHPSFKVATICIGVALHLRTRLMLTP